MGLAKYIGQRELKMTDVVADLYASDSVPVCQNRLLAALPEDDYWRLKPSLELIWMPIGKIIYESGDCLQHVYFPTTSVVSLLYELQNGESVEVAQIGNDGMIGIALFMGGESMLNRGVVFSAGHAYRLHRSVFKEQFNRFGGRRNGAMTQILLRYSQALVTQTAQTAACNRHHSLSQQLCRWLLLRSDRLPGNEMSMTQDHIANMLGVRREGICEAAARLQNAGLIQYSRGHIKILDRAGLGACACECYGNIKNEYDRLFPRPVVKSAQEPKFKSVRPEQGQMSARKIALLEV